MKLLDLVRIGPFRLFFPLGILCGFLGVGHWAFWTVGWIDTGSASFHTYFQVEGFLGCIATGFLMTFLPRVMGTREATHGEVWVAFTAVLALITSIFLQQWFFSQLSFLFILFTLIFFGARRLREKTKEHLPTLIFLDFGILHALLGSIFVLVGSIPDVNPKFGLIGRQMVQVGFLLCLVLGMTGFLTLPIFGYMRGLGNQKKETRFHIVMGLFLLISFLIEPWAARISIGIKAIVTLVHLLLIAKIFRIPTSNRIHIRLYHFACWMVPLGLWIAFLFPAYRIAGYHVMFIGGFSLLILSFGTLVVLSHTGFAQNLNKPLKPLAWAGSFMVLAMIFRLLADTWPTHYFRLLHSAAGFWLMAMGVWLVYILPKLWADPMVPKKG